MQPQCSWPKDQITRHVCPNFRDGADALRFDHQQSFLQRCLNCCLFSENLRSPRPEAGDLQIQPDPGGMVLMTLAMNLNKERLDESTVDC